MNFLDFFFKIDIRIEERKYFIYIYTQLKLLLKIK